MVTIKEVAKRAGVHPSTVSRALSGKIPVDEETKQKVMEAVEALNYQPNVLAKGLKEGKTNTIGLIIPNIQNPIFPAVARGVEDEARKAGFTVILCNTDEDLAVERNYVDKLQKRWVDGIIFATASDKSEHILTLKQNNFPVVLLVRHMGKEVDAIIADNYQGAYQAAAYLIEKGHRKIALINGDTSLPLYAERLNGYKQAHQDAGIVIDEKMILNGVSGYQDGYDAAKQLLNGGAIPDAVFATSDPKAVGVMRAVKDNGLAVPKDVAVVGFDDLSMSALLDPPLTTVAQPFYEMGAKAAARLIALIKNKNQRKPRVDILDTKLVVRNST